jgi:hypothetical protein
VNGIGPAEDTHTGKGIGQGQEVTANGIPGSGNTGVMDGIGKKEDGIDALYSGNNNSTFYS